MVGPGRARVEIAADFNHEPRHRNINKYNPDSRVVRSSQTRRRAVGRRRRRGGPVSLSTNTGSGAASARRHRDQNHKPRKSSITISAPPTESRPAASTVGRRHLTRTTRPSDGLCAAPEEQINRRRRTGFNAKRGDSQVEVVNLGFAETPPMDQRRPVR